MKKGPLQSSLSRYQPPINQSFGESSNQKSALLSHKKISKTADLQNIKLPQNSIDTGRQNESTRLPILRKQDVVLKKSGSQKNDEVSGLTDRVSEIKYPLFRTKSKRLQMVAAEPNLVVSAQTKRFIQSFLQKLKMVETYALQNQEAADQYIQLIYQLNRKQPEYAQMLTRSDKLLRSAEEQQLVHCSAANQKLRAELVEDLRKIRAFALKVQMPLHRKDVLSQSLELGSTQSAQKKQVNSTRKARLLPMSIKFMEKESNLQGNSAFEGSVQQKGLVPSDIFLSLKSKRRQSLPPKQRNKLGVGYLKSRDKKTRKESKKEDKCRISIIKQVVHHWAVDNRFIKVNTEIDSVEAEDERAYKPKSISLQKHIAK